MRNILTNSENPLRKENMVAFENNGKFIKSSLVNDESNTIITTDREMRISIYFEYEILAKIICLKV